MIGLISAMVLASVLVLTRRPEDSAKLVDPTKPAVAPGGGAFCDMPTPVKSTAYNPSSRKSE